MKRLEVWYQQGSNCAAHCSKRVTTLEYTREAMVSIAGEAQHINRSTHAKILPESSNVQELGILDAEVAVAFIIYFRRPPEFLIPPIL